MQHKLFVANGSGLQNLGAGGKISSGTFQVSNVYQPATPLAYIGFLEIVCYKARKIPIYSLVYNIFSFIDFMLFLKHLAFSSLNSKIRSLRTIQKIVRIISFLKTHEVL